MRKILIFALSLGCVFALSTVSRAENFLGAYIGAAMPHNADARDNTGTGVSGKISFDDGVAIGAKAGHWFEIMPVLGLELDANGSFSKTDKLNVAGVDFGMNSDVRVFSLAAHALLRYPGEHIRPYIGAGGGWFRGEFENGSISLLGATVSSFNNQSDDVFGWQALAGIDLLLTENASVFVEYKYSKAKFSFHGNLGLDVDYRESQAYIGVAYHF